MIFPLLFVGNCFLIYYFLDHYNEIITNPRDFITNLAWNTLNSISKLRIITYKIRTYLKNRSNEKGCVECKYLVLGIEDNKLKEFKFDNVNMWEDFINKRELFEEIII